MSALLSGMKHSYDWPLPKLNPGSPLLCAAEVPTSPPSALTVPMKIRK